MKCNLANFFLLSSLILGVVDLGFFIYGSVELYDLRLLKDSIHCSGYYNYCFYTNFIFLLSILVVLSYVCCVKRWAILPYIILFFNFAFNLGIGIDNFVNKNNYCGLECRNNCVDLINYGNNFTIFMITNLSCFGAMLIGFIVFSCK